MTRVRPFYKDIEDCISIWKDCGDIYWVQKEECEVEEKSKEKPAYIEHLCVWRIEVGTLYASFHLLFTKIYKVDVITLILQTKKLRFSKLSN